MKKHSFIQMNNKHNMLWILCFILLSVFAGAQKKTLSVSSGTWSNIYKIDSQEVSKKYFKTYMSSNDAALKTFKGGNNNKIVGDILTGIGAGLIGFNIGKLMSGGEKNYTVGGIGLGIFVLGLPISSKGNRKIEKSVQMFNNYVEPDNELNTEGKANNKKNFSEATTNAYEAAISLHNSGLVVRVATQSNKIKYLKKTLANPSISNKEKSNLRKKLNETITENKKFFDILYSGFKTHYHSSSVYFVPDSLYKVFLQGRRDVCLNEHNEVDQSIAGPKEDYFLMLSGNSIEQLLLVNKDGHRIDKPFPYKKSVFLPAFKKLGNRQKYVHDQIIWFDEKLKELKTIYR
ncbi:MAG: hypothetical protein IPO92_02900 [Saprospiraceae bacterium]|nr:hypothetical protein [Saprospiraceae bacterium]